MNIRKHHFFLGTSMLIALLAAPTFAATNWPQFRGSDSRGVSDGKNLPDTWSATENVEWKTDIPGRAWASPIVWGNKVFLATAVSEAEMEAVKKGLYYGGERPTPDTIFQWKVYALDLESGAILWDKTVHEGKPEQSIHLKNSYASETPVTDGEYVYVYFGNLGVWCLDFDGNEVWKKTFKPNKMRNGWGTAASPILHEDRLYIVNDNDEMSYLMALDKKTGDEVWKVDREDEGSNWATPYIWDTGDRVEIVTPGTNKVRSYDLDGNLLWWLEGMSSITIAVPYESGGLLYISSGYVGDRKSRPIYAIRPGANGDISLGEDETSNDSICWVQKMGAPYNPSTIVYDGNMYVLYDFGLLGAYNAADGSVVFESERIPKGKGFTSSPWAYDGKVFCMNEDGVTFVFEAGNDFKLLHTNEFEEDDLGMATPAIVGDRLLIRTGKRLYSIRNAQ